LVQMQQLLHGLTCWMITTLVLWSSCTADENLSDITSTINKYHSSCDNFLPLVCDQTTRKILVDGWNAHIAGEFVDKDTLYTLSTMVENAEGATVNHIPTATGGSGRSGLLEFYSNHFIHDQGDDVKVESIGRTISIHCDTLFEEYIFSFTHDKVIDWMIPGVKPTNKKKYRCT